MSCAFSRASTMIELDRISRSFQVGDQLVQALREVSLTIAAGEFVSIMGRPVPANPPCSICWDCSTTPTAALTGSMAWM